jgi:hypothetical protein
VLSRTRCVVPYIGKTQYKLTVFVSRRLPRHYPVQTSTHRMPMCIMDTRTLDTCLFSTLRLFSLHLPHWSPPTHSCPHLCRLALSEGSPKAWHRRAGDDKHESRRGRACSSPMSLTGCSEEDMPTDGPQDLPGSCRAVHANERVGTIRPRRRRTMHLYSCLTVRPRPGTLCRSPLGVP